MSFTSPAFFVFLPAVILLYWVIPQKGRMPLLLAASYLFYAYYDIRLLVLILITTLTTYLTGLTMRRSSSGNLRKRALILSFIVCLGLLFFFKYFHFAVDSTCSLLRLFGITLSFDGFTILLPMGISFYVFQTLSYSIDVYRHRVPAETSLGCYALFVVFFPQLVAGPIERPEQLLPQLRELLTPNRAERCQGLRLLLRGYAKKVLIADTFAGYVTAAYSDIPDAGGAALLAATVLFAFQIYCDFSGYSDIALGCAHLMGIRLSENFNHPYRAVTIRDFWRRWHISLTDWFRDYLYIPLGGNRKGLPRQCVNIFITFLMSGLWHGANLTYIIWGGIHGIYLVLETLLWKKKSLPDKWKLPASILTFSLVCFAWIFFRAASVADAGLIITSIFTNFMPQHLLLGLGAGFTDCIIIVLLLMLLPFIEKLPALSASEEPGSTETHTFLLYLIIILTLVLGRILLLGTGGSSAFIYFEF